MDRSKDVSQVVDFRINSLVYETSSKKKKTYD